MGVGRGCRFIRRTASSERDGAPHSVVSPKWLILPSVTKGQSRENQHPDKQDALLKAVQPVIHSAAASPRLADLCFRAVYATMGSPQRGLYAEHGEGDGVLAFCRHWK